VYVLVVLFVGVLQNTRGAMPLIFGARPMLLLPVVVVIAAFEGEMAGAAAGVGAGLLVDLYSVRLFGFTALLFMAAGCLAGLLIKHVVRNNFVSFMAMTAAALVGHGLIDWFFSYAIWGHEGWLSLLWLLGLPTLLYTLALSPAVYFLMRKMIAQLKIDNG